MALRTLFSVICRWTAPPSGTGPPWKDELWTTPCSVLSDHTGRYLVADRMDDPVVCGCNVIFRDNQSCRTVEIVKVPPLAADVTQCVHLHPHPQFCLHDRYICHTTIVHNRVDVALVPTKPLRDATAP